MMAAVPNVSAMDTLVAKSDSRNCFNEDIPLPAFRLFGVCNLIFILLVKKLDNHIYRNVISVVGDSIYLLEVKTYTN